MTIKEIENNVIANNALRNQVIWDLENRSEKSSEELRKKFTFILILDFNFFKICFKNLINNELISYQNINLYYIFYIKT